MAKLDLFVRPGSFQQLLSLSAFTSSSLHSTALCHQNWLLCSCSDHQAHCCPRIFALALPSWLTPRLPFRSLFKGSLHKTATSLSLSQLCFLLECLHPSHLLSNALICLMFLSRQAPLVK